MMKSTRLSRNDEARLIDALATAIVVIDSSFTVRKVNGAAQNLLAVSAVKLVGRPLGEFFTDAADLHALIARALREGRTFTERELELRLTNLQTRYVDCTVSPWDGESGHGDSVLLEMISVERHQRIQLEEAILMQNQVTAALTRGLAHEVKNPLGGIRGAAQLLERELEDQRLAEYTQIIIGEADRLRTLVDRMLAPHATFNEVHVNIHDVLERVRQIVTAEHAGALEIRRDYDPSLPELCGDRDLLIQAFLNLVRNAVRAAQTNDGSVTVRTRAQRQFTIGDALHRLVIQVDVIDTGPGVPVDIQDSIFYPMVSGHADGSGLGLPLAQSMINRHGGLIGFKSEPGQTEFSVWLPVEKLK